LTGKSPEQPLVSILTPSFNQGKWLSDNLESVANQTYGPIEHIVMDGGSTDETVSILKQAGPHVCWRSEPDTGQSHALNKAFAASRGEIIGWINSDDAYVDRRVVDRVVTIFASNSQVDLVYGDVLLVNERNEVLEYFPMSWGFPLTRMVTGAKNILKYGPLFQQPGVFLRRSAIDQTFVRSDLHFCMDHELWLRLASQGKVFQHVPCPLAIDRHQPDRKGLQSEFLEILAREHGCLEVEYGLSQKRTAPLLRKLVRMTQRILGVGRLLRMEKEVNPAFEMRLDQRRHRMVRQLFTRRAQMENAKGDMTRLLE
jgi:hypothetical protein